MVMSLDVTITWYVQAYFTVTSASTFAGAFTLTVMSADRCVAVCCPVSARNGCRTPALARLVILGVWALAVAAVFPVTVYAQLIRSSRGDRLDSATDSFYSERSCPGEGRVGIRWFGLQDHPLDRWKSVEINAT